MVIIMNYQKELDQIIGHLTRDSKQPNLLIHSCCAPCSSYVLEYLSQYFEITVFYYNPNIYPPEEYDRRVEEQQRLIDELPIPGKITFLQGEYHPEVYYQLIKGHEADPEGGERCFKCYEMRLKEAAKIAKEGGFDYFTTTLSISPHKNAAKLNEIGENLSAIYHVSYLPSDFKKKNGYKRSIELSGQYNLYRQDYCGCIFSRREADQRAENNHIGK
ncbi:MAG: hypothetical protein K0S47_2446 [Herbinix sp.]|nr:hypothetical protein [Herbinix sp.]